MAHGVCVAPRNGRPTRPGKEKGSYRGADVSLETSISLLRISVELIRDERRGPDCHDQTPTSVLFTALDRITSSPNCLALDFHVRRMAPTFSAVLRVAASIRGVAGEWLAGWASAR